MELAWNYVSSGVEPSGSASRFSYLKNMLCEENAGLCGIKYSSHSWSLLTSETVFSAVLGLLPLTRLIKILKHSVY
jgi:hypothetical protein